MLHGSLCAVFLTFSAPAFAEGTWTKNARMDEGRVLMQAASDGSDIYLAGGSSVAGPKASFDLYDTLSDMWRPLPPMPTARERFGMAGFSGRIYISGGRSQEMEEDEPTASDALWVFDTTSSDWVLKASMPAPRVDHAMINIGDRLFVIGGTGPKSNRIYVYNIVTDKWSTADATMSEPRKSFGVGMDGNNIYLAGGMSSDGSVSKRVDVYNVEAENWSSQAPLPRPLVGLAAAVIEGRLHVAGGSIPVPAQTFNEHLSRGHGERVWRVEPGLPTARHSMAYALAGGKWYIIGGGAAAGFYTLFSAADAVEAYSIN